MNEVDKNHITDSFEEVCEKHFLNARLETLHRIRSNLEHKISEIDRKIIELKETYEPGKISSLDIP